MGEDAQEGLKTMVERLLLVATVDLHYIWCQFFRMVCKIAYYCKLLVVSQ